MEWLSQMSLKRAYFFLTMLLLFIALALSFLSIAGIGEILRRFSPSIVIQIDGNLVTAPPAAMTEMVYPLWYQICSILQLVLPCFFVIAGLFLANWLFYRIKLEKPLAELQSGAARIMHNDLDFSVSSFAKDELGQLCSAFEAMRRELLKNNKELWRQAEERKRLNAAFSHDLRNPVTVLKGSVKLLKKGLANGNPNSPGVNDTISLMEAHVHRIETYIEAMSSTQRLEEIHCTPKKVVWSTLLRELSDSLALLSREKRLIIHDTTTRQNRLIWVDKSIVYTVAENLIANAVRYANSESIVTVSCDDSSLTIIVQDDGKGFPEKILHRGAEPFLRGEEPSGHSEHFGMGLYICRLLCEKHGGKLSLQNTDAGAQVTASFHIFGP